MKKTQANIQQFIKNHGLKDMQFAFGSTVRETEAFTCTQLKKGVRIEAKDYQWATPLAKTVRQDFWDKNLGKISDLEFDGTCILELGIGYNRLGKPRPIRFRADRDCDGNGITNEKRASWAEMGLADYSKDKYGANEEIECRIQDLITDLGHLCDKHNIDFDEVITNGHANWAEER